MSRIAKIVRKYRVGDHPITLVELQHGGQASGYSHNWEVGEKVKEIFDSKHSKLKILKLDSKREGVVG